MSEKTDKGTTRSILSGIGTYIVKTLSGITVSIGTVLVIAFFVYIFRDRIHDFFIPPNEITQVSYSIESELHDIGEFVTQECTYSGVTEGKNTRKVPILGADIPFSTNKVKVRYAGVIKAGYQVDDISITVLDHMKQIYISLPDPIIVSNEISQVGYEEENNILNPISGNAASVMLENVKLEEQKKAIEEGLYENAEKHAKEVITEKLSSFGGYSITFF